MLQIIYIFIKFPIIAMFMPSKHHPLWPEKVNKFILRERQIRISSNIMLTAHQYTHIPFIKIWISH